MNEYIKFQNGKKKYSAWCEQKGNIVTLHFTGDEIPSERTARGFKWYYNDTTKPSDYTAFDTVHRWDEATGIYQLSNDGSTYLERSGNKD